MRFGSVVERGAAGQGYRWTEYATPLPEPVLFGRHNFFFDDHIQGRHARGEGAQLYNLVAQGVIVLETNPDSSLADFGPVLMGQTFDYNPLTTQNILHDVP